MRGFAQRRFFAGVCLLLVWQIGCAAFHPVDGVPAHYLPVEMKIGYRTGRRTINPSLLSQPWSPHKIDTGDVLGVYIYGVVGKKDEPPPVHFPANNDAPPSVGLPFPVRDDGTISLPFVGAVNLRGLSIAQAEEKVTRAYLEPKEILKQDTLIVQVNLQRARQYRVLVIRQDSRNEPQANAFLGQMNIGMVKRGTGKVVNLPAYSNDVLNALTATDGLPGLDAENAVYVIRRRGNIRGGSLDPNFPLDFDPATLIRQSAAENGVTVRSQSPDGDSGAEYLHSQDILRAPVPSQSQNSLRYALGRVSDVNPPPVNGGSSTYGSLQPPVSIQPPRIWQDRILGQVDPTASVQGSYVTEASGISTNYQQFAVDANTPTPIGYGGNAYANGSYPAQGNPTQGYPTQNYATQGYPTQNYPTQGYPQQSYPPQGYSTQGYPVQSDSTSNYPTQGFPLSGSSSPSYAPTQGPLNQGYTGSNYATPAYSVPPGSAPGNPSLGQPVYSSGIPNTPQYASPQLDANPPPASPPPHGTPSSMAPEIHPQFDSMSQFNPGHVIATNGQLDGRQVVRIPIRLGPGESADIRPEDVILYDGDIVFIESRDTEVFYTGGLLGGGQYMLPRDYDLDILKALSLASSRTNGMIGNAIGGVSALNNDVAISPSTAIVLRKLPGGGEVPIKIDLYRARTDLSERIAIQPDDFILLQYTPMEAIAAFFERHLLETALFGLVAQQFNRSGTSN